MLTELFLFCELQIVIEKVRCIESRVRPEITLHLLNYLLTNSAYYRKHNENKLFTAKTCDIYCLLQCFLFLLTVGQWRTHGDRGLKKTIDDLKK